MVNYDVISQETWVDSYLWIFLFYIFNSATAGATTDHV